MTLKLKRNGRQSNHEDWTKLARCYDWNYKTSMNQLKKYGEYKGYQLEMIPKLVMNYSIPNQELTSFLFSRLTVQNNTFNNEEDGLQNVIITLGADRDYTITAEVNNRIGSEEVATDADGYTHYVDTTEIEIEIKKVVNQDGELVVLDADTKRLLLSKIEL